MYLAFNIHEFVIFTSYTRTFRASLCSAQKFHASFLGGRHAEAFSPIRGASQATREAQ